VFSIDEAIAAQMHWDVGAEVGALERAAPDRSGVARGPGLVGEAQAHVALFPMLRLGAYVLYDGSFEPRSPPTSEAGIRVKFSPPLLLPPWRAWAFLAIGYAWSYPNDPSIRDDYLAATLGIGVGAKIRAPWAIFAELAGTPAVTYVGFAASLSVGVSFDP
jgi:hypothetical protein